GLHALGAVACGAAALLFGDAERILGLVVVRRRAADQRRRVAHLAGASVDTLGRQRAAALRLRAVGARVRAGEPVRQRRVGAVGVAHAHVAARRKRRVVAAVGVLLRERRARVGG